MLHNFEIQCQCRKKFEDLQMKFFKLQCDMEKRVGQLEIENKQMREEKGYFSSVYEWLRSKGYVKPI